MRVAVVTSQQFRDRTEAGADLAEALRHYHGREGVVVLGLPRGGVPIADEVARRLGAPLDVFVVRKLGVPGHEELAMGAIASGGVRFANREVVEPLEIPETVIDSVARREQVELDRREQLYRGDHPPLSLQGKTVILVDDGVATGSTMQAAIRAARQRQPARVIVAAPVGAPTACVELSNEADEVVCVRMPDPFVAVGLWYADFTPTSDEEVRKILDSHPR